MQNVGNRKPKSKEMRKDLIIKYLRERYSVKEIAGKLNVHESTVYREIEKMKIQSNMWFKQLAEDTFIHDFHEVLIVLEDIIKNSYKSLEKLDKRTQDLRLLNEDLLKGVPEKKPGTSAMILQNLNSIETSYQSAKQSYYKIIEDCSRKYATLLNKGPRMYAIEQLLRGASLERRKQVEMKALEQYKEVVKDDTDDLNSTDE